MLILHVIAHFLKKREKTAIQLRITSDGRVEVYNANQRNDAKESK